MLLRYRPFSESRREHQRRSVSEEAERSNERNDFFHCRTKSHLIDGWFGDAVKYFDVRLAFTRRMTLPLFFSI